MYTRMSWYTLQTKMIPEDLIIADIYKIISWGELTVFTSIPSSYIAKREMLT